MSNTTRTDSISAWTTSTEQKKVPEGLWTKCPQCNAVLYRKELERNLSVCPQCDHHFIITARERINQILDEGTFEEWHTSLKPGDPLGFNDRRPYPERIAAEQKRTGLNEAALVGQGFVRGLRTVLCLTDSGFIMGSMGSVVGEKLTRAIETATALKLPVHHHLRIRRRSPDA